MHFFLSTVETTATRNNSIPSSPSVLLTCQSLYQNVNDTIFDIQIIKGNETEKMKPTNCFKNITFDFQDQISRHYDVVVYWKKPNSGMCQIKTIPIVNNNSLSIEFIIIISGGILIAIFTILVVVFGICCIKQKVSIYYLIIQTAILN